MGNFCSTNYDKKVTAAEYNKNPKKYKGYLITLPPVPIPKDESTVDILPPPDYDTESDNTHQVVKSMVLTPDDVTPSAPPPDYDTESDNTYQVVKSTVVTPEDVTPSAPPRGYDTESDNACRQEEKYEDIRKSITRTIAYLNLDNIKSASYGYDCNCQQHLWWCDPLLTVHHKLDDGIVSKQTIKCGMKEGQDFIKRYKKHIAK